MSVAGRDGIGDFIQPTSAGVLAAVVGFASAFTIVLQGLAAAGATPLQAASGLMALCVVKGLLGIQMGWSSRFPSVIFRFSCFQIVIMGHVSSLRRVA